MSQDEFWQAVAGCTHFLPDHYRKSMKDWLQEVADSPLAELRGDRYGSGGFVGELEKEVAEMLGKEAAVFMPSGTMAQQIALRIWSDRANVPTVAFHPRCHLQIHEQMAYRELHGLEAVLLGDGPRLFTFEDLQAVERPLSTLLIEFPEREIGGQLPTWDEFQAIVAFAKERGIRMHIDGARLWECQPYFGRSYAEIVADFDSVYVSVYKALRGLPGAILAGPADFIAEARIWLRRHGGNLFTMAPNAIAAKIGMDRHLPKIPLYVSKATEVAQILSELPGVVVEPKVPPTNMMHLYFQAPVDRLLDAAGQIALDEKCALIWGAQETPRGTKVELWIGDAGLDIPEPRLRELLTRLCTLAETQPHSPRPAFRPHLRTANS